jgi:hypothetical protein
MWVTAGEAVTSIESSVGSPTSSNGRSPAPRMTGTIHVGMTRAVYRNHRRPELAVKAVVGIVGTVIGFSEGWEG